MLFGSLGRGLRLAISFRGFGICDLRADLARRHAFGCARLALAAAHEAFRGTVLLVLLALALGPRGFTIG
jgi:hypothetical protein